MDIGGVWNGTSVIAKDTGAAITAGDEFSFTFGNSGATSLFEFKPQITFPAGVFIPASGAGGPRIDTIGASCPVGMAVSSVTSAAGLLTLNMLPNTGLGGFDLPAGCTFVLRVNGMVAKTASAGAIVIGVDANVSSTDGGVTVLQEGDNQSVLVRAGASTVSKTPTNQTRAVGQSAQWGAGVDGLAVQNTGLGGLFDVTLNESAIAPGGGLSLTSLLASTPGASCTATVCTLPYLQPNAQFLGRSSATVTQCQGILNTLSTNDLTATTAKSTVAQVTLDLTQPLLTYTPPSFTIPYGGTVNASLTVQNTSTGTARSIAAGGGIQLVTNYPALGVNIVVSAASAAAGWTYSAGIFKYQAANAQIAAGASVPLSFTASEVNACSFNSGLVQWTAKYNDDCGNPFNVPTQVSNVTKDPLPPHVELTKTANVGYRQIVGSTGGYTIAANVINPAGISGTNIVVTDTLPMSITAITLAPSVGTASCGGPCVGGSTVTWTFPKGSVNPSLGINYTAPTDVCLAGSTINNTASYSGTTVASCPITWSSRADVLLTLPPGVGVSQVYNVAGATSTTYETGLPDTNNNGVANKPIEGDLIPVTVEYSFGTGVVGTWAGSTYKDNFGALTAGSAQLSSTTLTVQIDNATGAYGAATPVPAASVSCAAGSVAANTCASNMTVNLAFLAGAGFFNGPNVAPTSGIRRFKFTYSTTVTDAPLPAPPAANATTVSQQVTQLGTLTLAGGSGGCGGNVYTQGDIYTIARAIPRVTMTLPTIVDVCQPVDAVTTISNATPSLWLNNLLTTLNTSATSDWRYVPAQTPTYTGIYPTTVPVIYSANGGVAPTWANSNPTQPFNANATITSKVFLKATHPAGTLPAALSAQVDYDDNQTAGAARNFAGTTGTQPGVTASTNTSVVRKGDIVATVSPQTVNVTGTQVQWRVFITNTGSGTAYNTSFTDTLPAQLIPNAAASNAANAGVSCAPASNPCTASVVGQAVTFNLGDIPAGQTRAVTLIANVNNSPPNCGNIAAGGFTAKWGCGAPFENAQLINASRPTFVFPAGQMTVQHDSAATTCVLCGTGQTVLRLRNTGSTDIFNMNVVETLNTNTQGTALVGTGEYSTDNGATWTAAGAPTVLNASTGQYQWTSTQVPPLAHLWPLSQTSATQPYEVLIRFTFSTNNSTATAVNPSFVVRTTGTVGCGDIVDTGNQSFNLDVKKPGLSIAKTATNRTAQGLGLTGAAGVGTYTENIYGGANEVVEWKVVVTNTGATAAKNLRLGDVFANTGGTGMSIVAGPACAGVAYPIALTNNIATNNLCDLPETAGTNTHTYYIRETLGGANACLSATNTADVSYGCTAGGGTNNRSGINGGNDPATVIRAPDFAAFANAGAQLFNQEAGGRIRVELLLNNAGGTAQNLSLTDTLPAGWKIDNSFTPRVYGTAVTGACTAPPTVAAGAPYTCTCTGAACLSNTPTLGGTSTVPVVTLPGQMRNATQARVVFYILPTNYDTTNASTFPNLATNETGALDPTPLAAGNNVIALNVGNTCGANNTVNNTAALDSAQPDLDVFLFNAANTSVDSNRVVGNGSAQTFNFRIRNVGEAGSSVTASTFTVQLGNGWTTPTVQLIGVAGSGYTGAAVACIAAGGGSYVCTQPAGSVLTQNLDYTVQVTATPTYVAGASLEVSGVARGLEPLVVGTPPANANLHSLDKAQYRVIGADLTKARIIGSTTEAATVDLASPAIPDLLIGEEITWAVTTRLWGMGANAATGVTFRDTYANVAGGAPAHNGYGFVRQVDAGSTVAGLVTAAPAAIGAVTPWQVNYTAASITGEAYLAKNITTRVVNHGSVQDNTILRNNYGVEFTYGGQLFQSSNTTDGFTGGLAVAALHKDADARARVPNVTMVKQVCNPSLITCNIATGAGFSAATSGDASNQFIFRIVLTNTGSAPAFDVAVNDVLQSPKLIMLNGSTDGLDNDQNGTVDIGAEGAFTTGAAGSVLFNQSNVSAPTIAKLTQLDPGIAQILAYKVAANTTTVLGGDVLTNLATLTYSTLPGATGGQTAPTSAGTPPPAAGVLGGTGERVFTSTATASIAFSRVYGRVYLDQNHNNAYEASDSNYVGAAVGVAPAPYLCAQLIQGGVLQASQVLSPTGTYSFSSAPNGAYEVRIVQATGAATCPAVVATAWNPAAYGYIPTEAPSQSRTFSVTASQGAPNLNFGLFRGTKVSGKVFLDNTGASPATTANDGVFNAQDVGLNAIPVCASSAAVTSCSGASVLDSTLTDASGDYTLWVPLASATQLIYINNAGAGKTSTGASVGAVALPNGVATTVGAAAYTYTYAAGLDSMRFTASQGSAYGQLNFGEIAPAIFTTDDARTVPAGSTTLYTHTFTASTTGSVSFSSSAVASPAGPWVEVLYLDTNCNGQIDATELPITAPVTVAAGQTVCIIHKELVPAGSAAGAVNTVSVVATFTPSNNTLIAPQVITRTDTTTVTSAAAGALVLVKEVCNATLTPTCPAYTTQNTGKGGDLLQYRIRYTNTGASAINNVAVQDSTPPFTTFQSADSSVLPNNLTACSKITPASAVAVGCSVVQAAGGTGAVKWTFVGSLLPGQSGFVLFTVQVQP